MKTSLKAVSATTLLLAACANPVPTLVRVCACSTASAYTRAARSSVLFDKGVIVDTDHCGGAGRTLLPGLIDANVHAFRYLELRLLFGEMLQLDMFNSVQTMQDLKATWRQGKTAGAPTCSRPAPWPPQRGAATCRRLSASSMPATGLKPTAGRAIPAGRSPRHRAGVSAAAAAEVSACASAGR